MGKLIEMGNRKSTKVRFLISISTLCFLIIISPSLNRATAQSYPDRPIDMIVPFGAGGTLDLGSRVIGEKIREFLGQPLITVLKPGSGGFVGTAQFAKTKPDGYTILVAAGSIISIPILIKDAEFKIDDFVPLGMYGKVPYFFIVKGESRWKTLKDFIQEEKKSPRNLKVAYFGKYSTGDFIIHFFRQHEKTELFVPVPFQTPAQALPALLGGHIDAALVTGAAGILGGGQIKALAVCEDQKLQGLPDIPTFKECGYPLAITSWNSFFMLKKTPQERIDKFRKAQEMAVKKYPKEIAEGLRRAEIWADFRSSEDTEEVLKSDYNFFHKMLGDLGVLKK